MTWLRVHVREEEDDEEVVGVCGISHATVRELGLLGGMFFPFSPFFSYLQEI
jgi:hypothetical protein